MEIFKDNERLSTSSKKLYSHNLKKLNDGKEITNLNFLRQFKTIDEKLERLAPNTRRSYIIAIVTATRGKDRFKSVNDYYTKQMNDINKALKDNTSKTEKEKDNWLTQEEVNKKFDELYSVVDEIKNKRKITDEKYTKLFLVVFHIYFEMKNLKSR